MQPAARTRHSDNNACEIFERETTRPPRTRRDSVHFIDLSDKLFLLLTSVPLLEKHILYSFRTGADNLSGFHVRAKHVLRHRKFRSVRNQTIKNEGP